MRVDKIAVAVLVVLFLAFFTAFEVFIAEPHREHLRACEVVR